MNVRELVDYCRSSRVVRVAIIYVPAAWVTLRAILITISGFDAPDWVPKTFGILLLIGYPIALIVSWAMDIGDAEEKRETVASKVYVPGGGSQARQPQTTSRTFGVLLFSGMAILGGAIYLMLNPTLPILEKPESEVNSVAVLPFLNLSADSGHQIFCDGLSEELLNLLTRVGSLQVAARTSSFAMRGKELDIPAIGEQLGVSHVLEGSVRRDDGQIRVTAQLVRSSDGFHLWSENYDRQFTQIFEIQDDIAKNIVAQLVTSLGSKANFDSVPEVDRTSPDAYFAYLKGRGALTYPGRESIWQAAQQFDEALEISPTYAPAMIGQLYTQTLLGLSDGQTLADRRQLFGKALQLFETSRGDAWVATAGAVLGLSLYEWEHAKDMLELGLGNNLSDVNLSVLNAELLLISNDIDGAAYEIKRIEKLAPGVRAATYLRALMDYSSSPAALENLFVMAADARNWSVGGMPDSVRDARQRLFRDCSDIYVDTDTVETDAGACSELRSFQIPLLALHGKNSAALEKLIAMTETRTFDAALTRLPEVAALLARPEAASPREILNLPAADPNRNLALLIR